MKKRIFLLFFTFAFHMLALAQFEPNYDESKMPKFELPNLLTSFKGKKIRNTKQWENTRRPELLEFFTKNVYGEVPAELEMGSFEIIERSDNALGGIAKRKQVKLTFEKNGKQLSYTILMYLPKSTEKAPLFVGYNFYGNHTIWNDANLIISDAWALNNPSFGIMDNQLTEQSRGVRSYRWPVQKIIESGYGLAVIYYGEIDPDKNDFSDGIHPLFYDDDQKKPVAHEWGSIAAWSWGLSRAVDYFEKDSNVDASKVIVFGHSRLGKTSLWAGATDERFAGVISNNSGSVGAALSKRRIGETVWRINKNFPHWFCQNFKKYSNKEETLPVDQHELIALIAPRPVYVASAEEDKWSDPKGEFLSTLHASPVYKLYGKEGITQKNMPEVNQPIQNTVSYHVRTGKHDVTDFDWEQYIKWADKFINE